MREISDDFERVKNKPVDGIGLENPVAVET
jgi:hypothetical protein